MLMISDLALLVLLTYFVSGWALGVFGFRSNFKSKWWKVSLFVWLWVMYFDTFISLVPTDVRWQWDSTPAHNDALVVMMVGFALAFTGGIWGAGFAKIRSRQANPDELAT